MEWDLLVHGPVKAGMQSFTNLQAAEKAAAQSNREISGYRIESISLTHERQEHYLRKHVGLAGPSGALASLQQGGSSGLAEGFTGYPSAEHLGAISGFPSQLVRRFLLEPSLGAQSMPPPEISEAPSPGNFAYSLKRHYCMTLPSDFTGALMHHQAVTMLPIDFHSFSAHPAVLSLISSAAQGGMSPVMPYEQQMMLSRLQGNMPTEQVLESMYGPGINQAALLQARHEIYPQQVGPCRPLSQMKEAERKLPAPAPLLWSHHLISAPVSI